MQILLLHAPPWKIPLPGEPWDELCGPPKSSRVSLIEDPDFQTPPYGLFSIAAQAIRAGHDVKLLNLSNCPWRVIEGILAKEYSDLFGLTCFTINRRGVIALAELIRTLHPSSQIAVGGPHAAAFPREMLEHCPAIDSVILGEGEETFIELLSRITSSQPRSGLAGAVVRSGTDIIEGPPRPLIKKLDSLERPQQYFRSPILLTSRGCPGQCTYCGSESIWHRKLRFHSAEYVLQSLENMVNGWKQPIIAVKDDTFTVNRQRALAICNGIIERNLRFVWSCDTRVDKVDEELLKTMRLAGCRMLSFGVESGSKTILEAIRKKITPQQVIKATSLARKFGFQIRFYMMWGNRGETTATLEESFKLIVDARPNSTIFNLLSIYPGTEEFDILSRNGQITARDYFTKDFATYKLFQGSKEHFNEIFTRISSFESNPTTYRYTVDERLKILQLLPEFAEGYLDLAVACCQEGKLGDGKMYAEEALKLNYPLPGLVHNCLACIAAAKEDLDAAQSHLQAALNCYPHAIAISNQHTITEWLKAADSQHKRPLRLILDCQMETNLLNNYPSNSFSINAQ